MAVLLPPVVSPARLAYPTAVLELPLSFSKSALIPTPVLNVPVVLPNSAPSPKALFPAPVVLKVRATPPTAVLFDPVLSARSALMPKPVLASPVVRLASTLLPPAVLPCHRWRWDLGADPKQRAASIPTIRQQLDLSPVCSCSGPPAAPKLQARRLKRRCGYDCRREFLLVSKYLSVFN